MDYIELKKEKNKKELQLQFRQERLSEMDKNMNSNPYKIEVENIEQQRTDIEKHIEEKTKLIEEKGKEKLELINQLKNKDFSNKILVDFLNKNKVQDNFTK